MNPEALSNEGQRHVASEMAQRIVQLETQLAEARAVLKELEHPYLHRDIEGDCTWECFFCDAAVGEDHTPDCRLAAALRED